ncbi:MAG: leucyl/phenylalanyl-tRNA--protein transferase [Actinomycetes bacterium]
MSVHPAIEPPPCVWELPDISLAPPDEEVLATGADLEPGTLLAAYRSGLFPMHVTVDDEHPLGWWSPNPRGIIDDLKVSRSLRRSIKRFRISVDSAFDDVIAACSLEHDGPQWINTEIQSAFRRLFDLGWAHSVEVSNLDGELVGGLYGVSIGGFFAGESMFHRVPDASKIALLYLKAMMEANGNSNNLLDVQWRTDHLGSMGAVEISRPEYLERLKSAVAAPSINFEAPSKRKLREWLQVRAEGN